MDIRSNPLGKSVSPMKARPPNPEIQLPGRYVTLDPVSINHTDDMYQEIADPVNHGMFDYLFEDYPDSSEMLRAILDSKASTTNPWSWSIMLHEGCGKLRAVGLVSLLRMDLPNRVIEVGGILYTPALQRTPAATEVQYLLARYIFDDLGFRRYEWKCNSLNAPSRRAAARLGFQYEGTFRQHMIVKGHNRDTAWFGMTDTDWPVVKAAFEKWLAPTNFDGEGKQRRRLEELREDVS